MGERKDLQQWVLSNPRLLGEPLLIIRAEFDKFDKSSRRLDLLALDENGSLVIVELKLDATGSLAELQAIRYAAFCSTMTIAQVISELAQFESTTEDEAKERICTFLEVDVLAELDNRPRIILAAGSFDDQELTSTVLWLRSFNVDISCIELTPYEPDDSNNAIIVPRTIIPIPEAKEYQIRVENKVAEQARKAKQDSEVVRFWKEVAREFNQLGTEFHTSGGATNNFMTIGVGHGQIHYEWFVLTGQSIVAVALHFQFKELEESMRWLECIKPEEARIVAGIPNEFRVGQFGKKWADAKFLLKYDEGRYPSPDLAPEAARLMAVLIERTWPLIKDKVRGNK